MKILVIGSGGREHALIWKIAQSRSVKKIYAAPGNAGSASLAECVDIKADDIKGLLVFAKEKQIDLTVVGPEGPLVAGIVDEFQKAGLKVFGPSKAAAQLEASKSFSKEVMLEAGVPTAASSTCLSIDEASETISNLGSFPVVIKADGLAAGKGVIICKTEEEAQNAVTDMQVRKVFGASGETVIIEEFLEGEEASILVLTDGESALPLASSQDHKRVFDRDQGPNTGGMGAYSPAPVVTAGLLEQVMEEVIYPVIRNLKKRGILYHGILYAGIMVTKSGPKVLEFNVRFGDPETQAVLVRLGSDLVSAMLWTIGSAPKPELMWDLKTSVCVVAASGGYPGPYENGREIRGLKEAAKVKDVVVFHAGTKKNNNEIVTNGGRVLGVTGFGATLSEAVTRAYEAIGKIYFDGMHYRKDIGWRALKESKN